MPSIYRRKNFESTLSQENDNSSLTRPHRENLYHRRTRHYTDIRKRFTKVANDFVLKFCQVKRVSSQRFSLDSIVNVFSRASIHLETVGKVRIHFEWGKFDDVSGRIAACSWDLRGHYTWREHVFAKIRSFLSVSSPTTITLSAILTLEWQFCGSHFTGP